VCGSHQRHGVSEWLNARVTDIPDARWGNDASVLARAGRAFAATKPGSWTIRKLTPLDRKIMVRTGGRFTALGPIGAPTMLLETTGRKSGAKRLSPLLFARDGDSIIVVGSNFGQDHHPAWTGNLLAHPQATVKIGGKDIPVTTQLLEGAEAEQAYQKMNEVANVYSVYRGRTARAIRVFRLTPTS
jgi:deazaflavin-dependent oxidoreductase (nitroreductase family)